MDAAAGQSRAAAAPSRPAERPWAAFGPLDAPAIVFLHGTRLTRSQWAPQLRALSGSFRCVAVDLPGHGARGAEPFTLDAADAAVVEALRAEVPSGRATLVGLSLGGYVAIETAARHPELVNGLVLAGCSGEAVGPLAWPFQLLAAILERVPKRVLDRLNTLYFRMRYRPRVAGPIVAGGFWSAGGAQAVRTIIGRHFLERLGRLWIRVLIVNGALDPVFGPGGDLWADSCRSGRSVVIPWATHLSSLDQPSTFSGLVRAFVREVAAGA